MTAQRLERRGLFSITTFSTGGTRMAYDLEKCFDLPAPAETIFDLRRDNAQAFVEGVDKLLGEGKSFQIFKREIVKSNRNSPLGGVYGGEIQEYGWTPFRNNAALDSLTFDEAKGLFLMRLKDTERSPEEQTILLEGMPKFAFLNRKHPNIHFRTHVALYISQGSHRNPFAYRSQAIYALKDVEDKINP